MEESYETNQPIEIHGPHFLDPDQNKENVKTNKKLQDKWGNGGC